MGNVNCAMVPRNGAGYRILERGQAFCSSIPNSDFVRTILHRNGQGARTFLARPSKKRTEKEVQLEDGLKVAFEETGKLKLDFLAEHKISKLEVLEFNGLTKVLEEEGEEVWSAKRVEDEEPLLLKFVKLEAPVSDSTRRKIANLLLEKEVLQEDCLRSRHFCEYVGSYYSEKVEGGPEGSHLVLVTASGNFTLKDILEERKKEKKSYEETELVAILKFLASGLRILMENHIYHSDIRLENIIVNLKKSCYQLTGFSKARSVSAINFQFQVPTQGNLLAPEFSQSKFDPFKNDVWALGLCFDKFLRDNSKFSPNFEELLQKMTHLDWERSRYNLNELEEFIQKNYEGYQNDFNPISETEKEIINILEERVEKQADLCLLKERKQCNHDSETDIIKNCHEQWLKRPDCFEKHINALHFLGKTALTLRKEGKEQEMDELSVKIKEVYNMAVQRLSLETEKKNFQVVSLLNNIDLNIDMQNWQTFTKNIQGILNELRALNIDEIRRLISKSQDASRFIKKKDIILLLGETGTGKSTTTHYLAGSDIRKIVNEKGIVHFEPLKNEKNPGLIKEIRTSYHTKSETRYISVVETTVQNGLMKNSIYICDTPGFDDTGGPEVDISNGRGIIKALRETNSVRPLLFICGKDAGSRLNGIRSLTRLVVAMMPSIEENIESFNYVFTKYSEEEIKGVNGLITDLFERIENESDAFRTVINDISLKTKNFDEINYFVPTDKNSSKMLDRIFKSKPIKYPGDVFHSILSERSTAAINKQMSKDKESALGALKRGEFDYVELKLVDIKYLMDLLEGKAREIIEPVLTALIQSISEYFTGEIQAILEVLRRVLVKGNSLTDEIFVKLMKQNDRVVSGRKLLDYLEKNFSDLVLPDCTVVLSELIIILKEVLQTIKSQPLTDQLENVYDLKVKLNIVSRYFESDDIKKLEEKIMSACSINFENIDFHNEQSLIRFLEIIKNEFKNDETSEDERRIKDLQAIQKAIEILLILNDVDAYVFKSVEAMHLIENFESSDKIRANITTLDSVINTRKSLERGFPFLKELEAKAIGLFVEMLENEYNICITILNKDKFERTDGEEIVKIIEKFSLMKHINIEEGTPLESEMIDNHLLNIKNDVINEINNQISEIERQLNESTDIGASIKNIEEPFKKVLLLRKSTLISFETAEQYYRVLSLFQTRIRSISEICADIIAKINEDDDPPSRRESFANSFNRQGINYKSLKDCIMGLRNASWIEQIEEFKELRMSILNSTTMDIKSMLVSHVKSVSYPLNFITLTIHSRDIEGNFFKAANIYSKLESMKILEQTFEYLVNLEKKRSELDIGSSRIFEKSSSINENLASLIKEGMDRILVPIEEAIKNISDEYPTTFRYESGSDLYNFNVVRKKIIYLKICSTSKIHPYSETAKTELERINGFFKALNEYLNKSLQECYDKIKDFKEEINQEIINRFYEEIEINLNLKNLESEELIEVDFREDWRRTILNTYHSSLESELRQTKYLNDSLQFKVKLDICRAFCKLDSLFDSNAYRELYKTFSDKLFKEIKDDIEDLTVKIDQHKFKELQPILISIKAAGDNVNKRKLDSVQYHLDRFLTSKKDNIFIMTRKLMMKDIPDPESLVEIENKLKELNEALVLKEFFYESMKLEEFEKEIKEKIKKVFMKFITVIKEAIRYLNIKEAESQIEILNQLIETSEIPPEGIEDEKRLISEEISKMGENIKKKYDKFKKIKRDPPKEIYSKLFNSKNPDLKAVASQVDPILKELVQTKLEKIKEEEDVSKKKQSIKTFSNALNDLPIELEELYRKKIRQLESKISDEIQRKNDVLQTKIAAQEDKQIVKIIEEIISGKGYTLESLDRIKEYVRNKGKYLRDIIIENFDDKYKESENALSNFHELYNYYYKHLTNELAKNFQDVCIFLDSKMEAYFGLLNKCFSIKKDENDNDSVESEKTPKGKRFDKKVEKKLRLKDAYTAIFSIAESIQIGTMELFMPKFLGKFNLLLAKISKNTHDLSQKFRAEIPLNNVSSSFANFKPNLMTSQIFRMDHYDSAPLSQEMRRGADHRSFSTEIVLEVILNFKQWNSCLEELKARAQQVLRFFEEKPEDYERILNGIYEMLLQKDFLQGVKDKMQAICNFFKTESLEKGPATKLGSEEKTNYFKEVVEKMAVITRFHSIYLVDPLYFSQINSTVDELKESIKEKRLNTSQKLREILSSKFSGKVKGETFDKDAVMQFNTLFQTYKMFEIELLKNPSTHEFSKSGEPSFKLEEDLMNIIEELNQKYKASKKPTDPQEVALILINLGILEMFITFKRYEIKNIMDEMLMDFKNEQGLKGVSNLGPILNSNPFGRTLIEEKKVFAGYGNALWKKKVEGTDLKYVLDKIEGDKLDVKRLEDRYSIYEQRYKQIIRDYLKPDMDITPIVENIKTKCSNLKVDSKSNPPTLTRPQLNEIPDLLGQIFALWSLMNVTTFDKNAENQENFLFEPHAGQVISIFRILGAADSLIELTNTLVQIGTGEGKSVTLAITCCLLALIGFEVSCSCYSEYLSERDYKAFLSLFRKLNVESYIKYGTFNKLSEQIINEFGDLRKIVENVIMPLSQVPFESAGNNRPKVLLIDEVDMFFNSEIYGASYCPAVSLRHDSIKDVTDFIWKHKDNMGLNLLSIQNTMEYKNLIKNFKGWETLIDECIKDLLYDLRNRHHEYECCDGRIGYKLHETISYNVVFRYKTLFANYMEFEKGKVSKEELKRNSCFRINIGNFAYAEIPLKFCYIMGVTGTLKTLSDYEMKIIQNDYKIKKFTYMPSMFLNHKEPFPHEPDDILIKEKKDFYEAIIDQIHKRRRPINKGKKEVLLLSPGSDDGILKKTRPLLVFFENESELKEFYSSPKLDGELRDLMILLTERDDINEKEAKIKNASTSNQITLITKSLGRGTDFVARDDEVNELGGVHVIQTFLSEHLSEEVQIQGRTARQGQRGSYSIIIQQEKLENFLIFSSDLEKYNGLNVYNFLCEKRKEYSEKQFESNKDFIAQTKKDHGASMEFFNAIQNKNIEGVKNFLLDKNKGTSDLAKTSIIVLMDATGSMRNLLTKVKNNIDIMFKRAYEILKENKLQQDLFQLQFAAYRNYSSGVAGILQVSSWDTKSSGFKEFLKNIKAEGGQGEEAIEIGLWHVNQELKTRKITQVILIGDAPANSVEAVRENRKQRLTGGVKSWDATKFGSPTHFLKEIENIKRYGVPVHCFYLNSWAQPNFQEIATLTNGECKYLDINGASGSEFLMEFITTRILSGVDKMQGKDGKLARDYMARYGKSFT